MMNDKMKRTVHAPNMDNTDWCIRKMTALGKEIEFIVRHQGTRIFLLMSEASCVAQ